MSASRRARARRLAGLDAEHDCREVYRVLVTLEFPWDMSQALSFALFRTYAVPSIGRLLSTTGELVQHTQKRYDDTALLLDALLEHEPDSDGHRTAARRINAMHAEHDISDEDMRYVLSTFVVSPIRWLDAYGWRRLTEHEKSASAHYYRGVGRLLGVRDIPLTWRDFVRVHDAYEARHFSYDEGGRSVADATLRLLATFPWFSLVPAPLVHTCSRALMDDPLLAALRYDRPPAVVRSAVRGGLRLRGHVVRRLPVRTSPLHGRELPTVRGYRDGYELAELGTFPRGCPGARSTG